MVLALERATGVGERFSSVQAEYERTSEEEWTHTAYRVASGVLTMDVPVDIHRVQSFRIFIRGGKQIDVMSYLPRGHQLGIFKIQNRAAPQLESNGLDFTTIEGRHHWANLFPVESILDIRRIHIPLYGFYRNRPGIDKFAEEILFQVGVTRAPLNLPNDLSNVHPFALKFAEEILGENPHLLEAIS